MGNDKTDSILAQIDDALEDYRAFSNELPIDNEYQGTCDLHRIITKIRATIERATGTTSPYAKQMAMNLSMMGTKWDANTVLDTLVGILDSLHSAIVEGYLDSMQELAHGEVFQDFLEMASHLAEEKYKDAAAVIAGSSLESHLRQLCSKCMIPTDRKADKGELKPKQASALNDELRKAEAYSKGDQKQVTAWLDLRNDAAHGHYEKYDLPRVKLMIDGIRHFISMNPA